MPSTEITPREAADRLAIRELIDATLTAPIAVTPTPEGTLHEDNPLPRLHEGPGTEPTQELNAGRR